MALTLFRILEKRLDEAYTAETLIKTLREMDLHQLRGKGYLPLFKRTLYANHWFGDDEEKQKNFKTEKTE